MIVWQYIRSVLIAVVIAPYVTTVLGIGLTVVQGNQSLSDAGKVLLLSPIAGSFLLVITCWWSIPATAIAAAALSLFQRYIWPSVVPNIVIAIVCGWQIPSMLAKFPHGDSGSMGTLVEQMKAVVMMSIALWCLYFAVHIFSKQG